MANNILTFVTVGWYDWNIYKPQIKRHKNYLKLVGIFEDNKHDGERNRRSKYWNCINVHCKRVRNSYSLINQLRSIWKFISIGLVGFGRHNNLPTKPKKYLKSSDERKKRPKMGETNEPIRTREVKYWRRDRGFPLLRILHPFRKDTTKRPKIFFSNHKISDNFFQISRLTNRNQSK